MTKDQLSFARVDREIVKQYKETCKLLGIKPGEDLARYMAEVVRTKGITVREAQAEELIRQGMALREEVKAARVNLHEAFTDAMLYDVDKALARKSKEGAILQLTYESVEYYVKDISERHHVPAVSVLVCMRQRALTLYADDSGELDRVLKMLEGVQDDIEGMLIHD